MLEKCCICGKRFNVGDNNFVIFPDRGYKMYHIDCIINLQSQIHDIKENNEFWEQMWWNKCENLKKEGRQTKQRIDELVKWLENEIIGLGYDFGFRNNDIYIKVYKQILSKLKESEK